MGDNGELLIIPISQSASDELERLRAVSKLRKTGRADLLSFEYCRNSNRATLVTRNTPHFKQIPGMRVLN